MTTLDLENRIRTAPPLGTSRTPADTKTLTTGPTFSQVLQGQIGEPLAVTAARAGIKFSGHAQTRLASRQITLTESDVARLGQAMTKAASKGSKDSLVLMDKTAFVVSVANRTVITAVASDALKENIFTNIDSAMIL
ncbi:MAG: TIGR02530 family flagellar biosynthesis protein [Janthinobacterium lividum]